MDSQHLVSRRFVTAGLGTLIAAPAFVGRASGAQIRWQKEPFSLGVAAGSPTSNGFVLWTRLAPDPLSRDPQQPHGMSRSLIPVDYEIATTDNMRDIIARGTAVADPSFAHAVHAEIKGLEPARTYWYRFHCGDAVSRIGRASTLPAPDSTPQKLRFGFVSCSNYEHGYFSAYRHLADEHPDLVLFLGDYIYEYIDKRPGTVRTHSDGVEATTLATYRNRYAQYRMDPDLQRLHAEVPALFTWDDHEVQNDYADRWSRTFDDPAQFLVRRAAAYQAFYEHMPVRPSLSTPVGPTMRIFDRFTFGNLVEISMIDGRQYRSREACYGSPNHGGAHLESDTSCPELRDGQRSILGAAQEDWLFRGLAATQSRWNVIAQDVLMAQLQQRMPDGDVGYWTDDWNGYPASRQRLLQQLHDHKTPNPVVIGGDIHSYWANDLKLDFDKASSPVVATEFVGISVSSHGPSYEKFAKLLPDNPHIRFFESRVRGYVAVDVSPQTLTARFQTVSEVTDPNATLSTLKAFAVENGRPGVNVA